MHGMLQSDAVLFLRVCGLMVHFITSPEFHGWVLTIDLLLPWSGYQYFYLYGLPGLKRLRNKLLQVSCSGHLTGGATSAYLIQVKLRPSQPAGSRLNLAKVKHNHFG